MIFLSSFIHCDEAMTIILFHKRSTLYLLIDQFTGGREIHFHFDLLKATIAPDQSLADNVAVPCIVETQVVIQIHAPFDDLTAAPAFDFEGVIMLFRLGACAAEEIFEEAHIILSIECCQSYTTSPVIFAEV